MARILVVDDEPLIALLTEEWVAELGHTPVGPAGNLKAAFELVANSEIDGAIIDVTLGRESAYPLAEALAARGVPFAFATGLSEAAIERGHAAVAVLVKPFGLKPFTIALEAIVDARSLFANGRGHSQTNPAPYLAPNSAQSE